MNNADRLLYQLGVSSGDFARHIVNQFENSIRAEVSKGVADRAAQDDKDVVAEHTRLRRIMKEGTYVQVERFADNGEHSHWDIVDKGTGVLIGSRVSRIKPGRIMKIELSDQFIEGIRERFEYPKQSMNYLQHRANSVGEVNTLDALEYISRLEHALGRVREESSMDIDSEPIRLEILAHGVPASLLGEYEEALENERKEPATAEGYIELVHRHIREIEEWKAQAIPRDKVICMCQSKCSRCGDIEDIAESPCV